MSVMRRYFNKITDYDLKGLTGVIYNIGCGRERFETRGKVIQVDNYKECKPDLMFDITKVFPLKNEVADCVTCFWVLEHVHNPREVMREIHRITKVGGKVYLAVPFLVGEHDAPADYFRYTKQGVKELLKDFEIEKIDCVGGRFITVAMVLEHHAFPKILIPLVERFALFLEKFEKHKERYTTGFYAVAKKV